REIVQAGQARRVAAEMPGRLVADVADADRVELVQHAHRSARVPPGVGERGEARHLPLVHRAALTRAVPRLARRPSHVLHPCPGPFPAVDTAGGSRHLYAPFACLAPGSWSL